MAYRHVTSCIPLGQQQSKVDRMVAYGVPLGIAFAIAGAIIGGGIGAVAGFSSTLALSAVLGFCDWWFHYRLICNQDDQCAVGTVGRTAVSTGIDDPDLDFTINLVLAPIDKDSKLKAAAQKLKLPTNQRRYLEQQTGYPNLGGVDQISTVEEDKTDGTTALHCEIEGNGMQTVCTTATVAGVVGTVAGTAAGIGAGSAAATACAATGIFFLLCVLIVIIAAAVASALASGAVTGVGWVLGVGLGGDEGSPADVAVTPGSGTVSVGDHLAIVGDWIFDNAHDGWHELHPVKKVFRIPCQTGTSVPGVDPEVPESPMSKAAIERACLSYLEAEHGADLLPPRAGSLARGPACTNLGFGPSATGLRLPDQRFGADRPSIRRYLLTEGRDSGSANCSIRALTDGLARLRRHDPFIVAPRLEPDDLLQVADEHSCASVLDRARLPVHEPFEQDQRHLDLAIRRKPFEDRHRGRDAVIVDGHQERRVRVPEEAAPARDDREAEVCRAECAGDWLGVGLVDNRDDELAHDGHSRRAGPPGERSPPEVRVGAIVRATPSDPSDSRSGISRSRSTHAARLPTISSWWAVGALSDNLVGVPNESAVDLLYLVLAVGDRGHASDALVAAQMPDQAHRVRRETDR